MVENFGYKAINSLLKSHQLTREAIEQGFEQTRASIDALDVQIGQLSQLIKQQTQNIGRIETSVERENTSIGRLPASVDNYLKLAEQQNETAKMQAANISDLTRLVATQSETVNRLLERLAA